MTYKITSAGRLGSSFSFKSYDLNFGWCAFSWNRSDPATHRKSLWE